MKKILAVDESQMSLDILSQILSDSFEVITARSGFDMNMTMSKGGADLILINTNMRTASGVKLIAQLRHSGEDYAGVPVVFISEDIDQHTIEEISSVKALDLIKKPFEPMNLEEHVKLALNKVLPPTERIDVVTGLHKRQYIDQLIMQCIENKNYGTMFIMDFDNYSFASNTINQASMKQIADVLKNEITGRTIYGVTGGSSVLGYIQGGTDKAEILAVAERLIKVVHEKMPDEKLYISIGLATLGRNGDTYPDLYQSCDRALSLARSNGKNCACFYS